MVSHTLDTVSRLMLNIRSESQQMRIIIAVPKMQNLQPTQMLTNENIQRTVNAYHRNVHAAQANSNENVALTLKMATV